MIVYRIIENDPAVEWDVLSHAERGIKPRSANSEMLHRWRGTRAASASGTACAHYTLSKRGTPEDESSVPKETTMTKCIRLTFCLLAFLMGFTGSPAFASPVTGATPSPSGITVKDGRFPVSGNAFDLLSAGEPNTLSIVAQGPLVNGTVSIVLKNNTKDDVTNVTLGAEARDASGKLLGSVSYGTVYPAIIGAGSFELGWVYFGTAPLPDAKVTVYVDSKPVTDLDIQLLTSKSGVSVTEFAASKEQIIGAVTNTSSDPVNDPYMLVSCWNDKGVLSSTEVARTARKVIAPGESSAFSVITLGSLAPSCDKWLLTGS